MTTGREYLALLEESYAKWCDLEPDLDLQRCEFLTDYVFGFATYDAEISEFLCLKAVEVSLAICNRSTFAHINRDEETYRWFVAMVNMPFFQERLNWGTSIRGAFWDPGMHEKTFSLDGRAFWRGDAQISETMRFTGDEWKEFLLAVADFIGFGTDSHES